MHSKLQMYASPLAGSACPHRSHADRISSAILQGGHFHRGVRGRDMSLVDRDQHVQERGGGVEGGEARQMPLKRRPPQREAGAPRRAPPGRRIDHERDGVLPNQAQRGLRGAVLRDMGRPHAVA